MRAKRAAGCLAYLLLSGCLGAPSPAQVQAVISDREANDALAREHKITWAEAARRSNETMSHVGGSSIGQQDRLMMAYKAALYAEIDAGRMTPEMARYRIEEKKAEIANYNDEQRRQAFANLANVGVAMMQTPPPPSPVVSCTSTSLGITTNTVCH